MYTNVNLTAPVGALSFLGTVFLFFVVGLVLVYSLVKRKLGLTKLAVAAAVVIAGVYFSLMLIFSFMSSDQIVARGQEKHFCEIDCHLAYSVTDVRETQTLGEGASRVTAAGMFRLISLRTRFDENTISPTRGNGLLHPNSRVLSVVDQDGKKYFPSNQGQQALKDAQLAGTPITTPLRPGEAYTTTFVFDLPADIRNPTLLIREGELNTYLLIGHENSLLHKKTKFQL